MAITLIKHFDARLSRREGKGLKPVCQLVFSMMVAKDSSENSEEIDENDYSAAHMTLGTLLWECPRLDPSANTSEIKLISERSVEIYASGEKDSSMNEYSYAVRNIGANLAGKTTVKIECDADVSENKTFTIDMRGS